MTDGRKPSKTFTHIGEVLQDALRNCRRETNEQLAWMDACWSELVGDTIGQHSYPAAMKGRLLLVNVSSSVWLHEMRFLKTDLIEKINQRWGQPLIGDIKFKVA